jgi:hypothetical protein
MRRTDLGPVTKLEYGRDDVHDECSEELPNVMVQRIVDLADDEAEVQCRRENEAKMTFSRFMVLPPGWITTRSPWVRRGRRYFFSTMTRPSAFWNTR